MGGASSPIAVGLFVAAALAGCDSRAKASDPAGPRGDAKSREYESCGASLHCQDELRCFENVCRRAARSTVGDYYAALGARHRNRGELEAAIQAYNKSLGLYDTEKLALPPDIDCAYGATLAAAKAKKEHAELAARVLHRCILAVPAGSSLRDRALAELAGITDAGLEPLALGRTSLADVYLTRAPQKPSTDKLQVSLVASPPVDKKSFPLVTESITQPDLKPALVACWQAYNAAAKKTALAVTLGVRWQYIPSQYDDEPGRYAFKLEPAAGGAGPDAAAEACVRAAVEPALKSLAVRDSFATSLTIAVK